CRPESWCADRRCPGAMGRRSSSLRLVETRAPGRTRRRQSCAAGDGWMGNSFWDAFAALPPTNKVFFAIALAVAVRFRVINRFHDTANAVTTVIYTRTLKPTLAVLYSGLMNFLGVLLGGTAVAFAIVNLLPVDLLIESASVRAVVMVLSLLLAGVIWNLATWWLGLPVSSSHTLIGSILGVGLVNSLVTRGNMQGVNWSKAG